MPPAKPKVFREHCFHEYQPNLKGRNSYRRHACPEVPKPANHVPSTPVVPIPPTPPRAPQRPAVLPIEPSGASTRPPLQAQLSCAPTPQFPALHTPQSVLEYVNQMQHARDNLHLQQRMLERQMTVLSGFLAPELVQQLNTAQHELAAQLAQAQVQAHTAGASMPIPIGVPPQHLAVRRLSSGSMQPLSPASFTQTPPTPTSDLGTPEMNLSILDCASPSGHWDHNANTFDAATATPVAMNLSPLGMMGIPDGMGVAGQGLHMLDAFALRELPPMGNIFDACSDFDDSCTATDNDEFDSPTGVESLLDMDFEFTAGPGYELDAPIGA